MDVDTTKFTRPATALVFVLPPEFPTPMMKSSKYSIIVCLSFIPWFTFLAFFRYLVNCHSLIFFLASIL